MQTKPIEASGAKYRWTYEMSLFKNPTIFIATAKAIGIAVAITVFIIGLISLIADGFSADSFRFLGELTLILVGIFAVLLVLGYLLYATLYAAIGSLVDNNTDSQQFTLPVTVPLLIAIITSFYIVNNPDSSLAIWLSMIPFTSPISMMVRIPFGVPIWQIVLSVALLAGTFVLMTWVAAKIYRTGILMYGKKLSYKEIFKWLKYK